jgi:hypothetical protein
VSTDPDAPQGPAGAPGGEPAAPGPSDAAAAPGPGPAGPAGPGPQPSEEELRAAYEAELARITSTDMILQAAVSLLNVGSYRLMPQPAAGEAGATPPGAGRDLEQVRDAIDGVRALLEILERRVPSEVRPLRDALSQLQMAYAREVQASGAEPAADAAEAGQGGGQAPPGGSPGSSGGAPGGPGDAAPGQAPGQGPAPGDQGQPGPGPAESSGRLWVPGR